jgi:hypothetical protein
MTVFAPLNYDRITDLVAAARRLGLGPPAFTRLELESIFGPWYLRVEAPCLLGEPIELLPEWPRWFVTACRQIDGDLA